MQRFVHHHFYAVLYQFGRASQSRRPAADNGNPFARKLCGNRFRGAVEHVVADKAFQRAYRDGLRLYAAYTFAFALIFLRTHPSAYRGQRICVFDYRPRFIYVAGYYSRYKIGDMHGYGTALHTWRVFTMQTAFGLGLRRRKIISCGNLNKIAGALTGRTLGNFVP